MPSFVARFLQVSHAADASETSRNHLAQHRKVLDRPVTASDYYSLLIPFQRGDIFQSQDLDLLGGHAFSTPADPSIFRPRQNAQHAAQRVEPALSSVHVELDDGLDEEYLFGPMVGWGEQGRALEVLEGSVAPPRRGMVKAGGGEIDSRHLTSWKKPLVRLKE